MVMDAVSGFLHSTSLPFGFAQGRSVSVGMTGVMRRELRRNLGWDKSVAPAKRQRSGSLTARSYQRLDLGIQDGMSRGIGVAGIGCRTGEAVWGELPDAAC